MTFVLIATAGQRINPDDSLEDIVAYLMSCFLKRTHNKTDFFYTCKTNRGWLRDPNDISREYVQCLEFDFDCFTLRLLTRRDEESAQKCERIFIIVKKYTE